MNHDSSIGGGPGPPDINPIVPPNPQLHTFARRLALLGAALVALLALGTLGLALSEHVGAWYAFRWALDTVATVGGFSEPHSTAGQVIHVALIVLGVGTLFYALATTTEFLIAGHLGDLLAARRAQKMIDSLSGHHIVCGFGRVGRQVARDLRAARAEYVVIDARAENRDRARDLGERFVAGDAADDAVLHRAGIARARSIVACADSDAENIFITLTARELRADIAIVARAAAEDSEKKLKRAGADRVISPYKASGTEMARLALHPQLSGVVDVDAEYRMEEIVVRDGCAGARHSIGDIRGGAMIVGLRRDADFQPQPPAEIQLLPGDVVIAMGTPGALERLEELFKTEA
ncbi:MAG TPA: TrkA family potassium uptake protein [Solirubrobacteraceae bacterium]|jgi:voltage-gated potassium channel|nr:TrkA family potassium uptake protein [Solirubrobacteraceae bacterium]